MARVVVYQVQHSALFVRLEVIVPVALHLQLIAPPELMSQALEVDIAVKIVSQDMLVHILV